MTIYKDQFNGRGKEGFVLGRGGVLPAAICLLLVWSLGSAELAVAQARYEVQIQSEPAGEVFRNGVSMGRTPMLMIVPAGSVLDVEVRAAGYMPWNEQIAAEYLPDVLPITLTPATGNIRLLDVPIGSRLELDGRVLVEHPAAFEVAGPAQALRIRLPNRRIVRQQLAPLHEQTLVMALVRTYHGSVLRRSLLVPGWGQAYDGHRIEGAIFFLAGIGTAAYLVHSERQYRQRVDAYWEALTLYKRAIIEAEIVQRREELLRQHAAVESKNRQRQHALIALVGTYVTNAVSTFVLHAIGYALEPVAQQSASADLRVNGGVIDGRIALRFTVNW